MKRQIPFELIYQATVAGKTMPLGNVTGMTDGEREQIALWYAGLGARETLNTAE